MFQVATVNISIITTKKLLSCDQSSLKTPILSTFYFPTQFDFPVKKKTNGYKKSHVPVKHNQINKVE